MFQYDSRRTSCHPETSGPKSEPDTPWSQEMGSVWGSPVVRDGVVYVGSYDRYFYALDAGTGAVRWRYETSNDVDTTPAIHDDTVFFGGFDKNIYALDTRTGEEEWVYETEGYVRSSPLVVDDTLYIGGNCRQLECDWNHPETANEQGDVFAIDADSGELRWRARTEDGITSSPAIDGGTLYIGSSDDNLYALDASTGEELWTYETEDMVISTPTVHGGTIYVGDWAGNVHAVTPRGESEWVFETEAFYISGSPAVCGDTVYIGVAGEPSTEMQDGQEVRVRRGKVYALSAESGEEQWSVLTDAEEIGSTPAIADGVIYVGAHSLSEDRPGVLFALDGRTGDLLWSREVPGIGVGASPAVANGNLYIGVVEDRVSGHVEALTA